VSLGRSVDESAEVAGEWPAEEDMREERGFSDVDMAIRTPDQWRRLGAEWGGCTRLIAGPNEAIE
jgi:hypothetical protein